MVDLQNNNTPSKNSIIPHFLIGSVNWVLAILIVMFNATLLFNHHFNYKLIALTHLITLGWITTVIFGALYQLLPVILKSSLYSEKLALASLVFLQAGTWTFFFCFWFSFLNVMVLIAAAFLAFSVLLFARNVIRTIRTTTTIGTIESKFILTAVIWLILTALFGCVLSIHLVFPFLNISHIELLKVHAHFGIIGWFLNLIIGVSIVLFPMFLLSHDQTKKHLIKTWYLSNSALVVGFLSVCFNQNKLLIIAYILGVLSFLPYCIFILQTYLKRVKKKSDIGMKISFFSLTWIVISFIVSLQVFINFLKTEPWQMNLYVTSLLLGFVSSLIMGQTYKTLPFIIWLSNHKTHPINSKKVLPKELYAHNRANWQFAFHILGLVLILIAFYTLNDQILTVGFLSLLIAATLYFSNIYKIISTKNISK